MPQITVNTPNISIFGWSATVDVFNRTITFNIASTTGSGLANTKVSFSVIDQDGVVLATVDFTNPANYIVPTVATSWVLDLSDSPFVFLFQAYKIVGSIQDQGGTVYSTSQLITTICQPNNLQDTGYVNSDFVVTPDCPNNILTVKELTLLIYNNLKPISVSKSGTLNYPPGTLAPVAFTNTPFTNTPIYTGNYTLNCTTLATYAIGNDIYVAVTYKAVFLPFTITCTDKIGNLICCIEKLQESKERNCDNVIGKNAAQLLQEIQVPFFLGIGKEVLGMDASSEYEFINKKLNCSCGNSSVGQNEATPVNPSIYNIILQGVGGTTTPAPVVSGSTKTFPIQSNVYQVTKGNPADPGFTIDVDNSVPNTVKYPITFNYLAIAQAIYTATAGDPATLAQFNSLVQAFGFNISGLDGKCVIDLTQKTYVITQPVTGATGVASIFINGTSIAAPGGLLATDTLNFANWLNSLALGAWTVNLNGGVVTVQSVNNTNTVSTITFTAPDVVLQFQLISATLLQVVQAIVNYLCSLTAFQIALGSVLQLCYFDYNGNIVQSSYNNDDTQADFNAGVSQSICNLANRINTLTGVTCDKMKTIFQSSPSAAFNPATDSLLAFIGTNCLSITAKQLIAGLIAQVNADTDSKNLWCSVDCSVPGTCPDIANFSLSALSQTSIGIFSINWVGTTLASQTVTVQYRVTGSTLWTTATGALGVLPSGALSGSSPFIISGLVSNTSYDVFIKNNCGGVGFLKQVITPSTAVLSGSFLLSNASYTICGAAPVTLYSSLPFGPGVQMYTDAGLTIPKTGFIFIASQSSGHVFGINSGTGVVSTDTGLLCASGTPGTFLLGTNPATVCSQPSITLYTNGSFGVGVVLYYDSALSSPVTGFTYVVNAANNQIFNLSNVTGVVGAATGSSCTGSATLTFHFVHSGGGGFLNFQATLNRSIDGTVNITKVFADGFSDGACSSNVASAQKNSLMQIPIGGTGVGQNPDSTTGSWASAIKDKVYNVIVNGSPCVNGTVVAIGTYNVTMVIPACE